MFELFINWQDLRAFDRDALNGVTFAITRTMTNLGVFIFSCNASIMSHFMLCIRTASAGCALQSTAWTFFRSFVLPLFFERWWIGNSTSRPLLLSKRLIFFVSCLFFPLYRLPFCWIYLHRFYGMFRQITWHFKSSTQLNANTGNVNREQNYSHWGMFEVVSSTHTHTHKMKVRKRNQFWAEMFSWICKISAHNWHSTIPFRERERERKRAFKFKPITFSIIIITIANARSPNHPNEIKWRETKKTNNVTMAL